MNMKYSRYNEFINVDEKIYLYNTFSGALINIDEKTMEKFKITEKLEIVDTDVFSDDELEILKKCRFIVSSDIDELDFYLSQKKEYIEKDKTFRLTIAPTLDCNFRCPYCFEEHQKCNMNESVQEELCKWLDSKLSQKEYETLSVTWFGGEPLMFPNIIKKLSRSFISSCDKYSVDYNASMITNGYLIEKVGSSCFLNECKITTLQITIDGTKETHNQRRILVNNPFGTYDKIISGINSLADGNCQIKVRVNLDKINSQVLEETCSQLAENIKNKENVYPYIAKMYCMDDLNAGIEDSVLKTEEYVLSAITFSELAARAGFKVKKKSIIPKAKMWYCPAPYGKSLVIDPDGDLYYCWNDIGIKEYRTGSIVNDDNDKFADQRKLWSNHAFDFHSDCKACKSFVLCAGGCVREKIRTNKDYTCVDFAKCSDMTIKHYLNKQG